MTARGTERFRNYGAVLERHEKEKRIKKILKVFGFFLIILIVVMMIVIVVRVERKSVKKNTGTSFLDKKINKIYVTDLTAKDAKITRKAR